MESKIFIELTTNDRGLLSQINIVKLLTHFTALVLSLELGLWMHAQELLKKIEVYCHELFSKQNVRWGYENLREDFFDALF